MSDILTAYRPRDLNDVIGQEGVVRSLKGLLKLDSIPHCFLFHGPSGTGKTTLGRILADKIGCPQPNLIEIDAASYSGADAMRKISSRQQFQSIDGDPQVTIVDECHALSTQAWQVLLKPLEESPESFYWVFCTTNYAKVPATIRGRCHQYKLDLVSRNDLADLIEEVSEEEGIELPEKVLRIILDSADGSPRQALSNLSVCRNVSSSKEAEKLLKGSRENKDVIELCRYILFNSRPDFKGCVKLIRAFKDDVKAETVRMIMLNYCSSVVLNPKGKGNNLEIALAIMSEFSQPFYDSEGMAPVIVACGNLMIEDD